MKEEGAAARESCCIERRRERSRCDVSLAPRCDRAVGVKPRCYWSIDSGSENEIVEVESFQK